jgi:hypothetical protein
VKFTVWLAATLAGAESIVVVVVEFTVCGVEPELDVKFLSPLV